MSVGFPVQSLPLIKSSLSITEMKQTKNVIVLETTNSQTVVLQSDLELIKLKGFCLVVYRSFEGHVRHFFVQDADGLENRLVRVSDVRIIYQESPAYVNPSGGCFERRYKRNVQ